MKKINIYILKNLSAPFFFGTFTVIFLFLTQFLMNSLDKFTGKGLSNWVILQIIGYSLPWMSIFAFPMGVLFATLMAFGSMSGSHETTIIKSSGGNLFGMMKPVVIVGIFLTMFLFWFNNDVLPESNHRFKKLSYDISRTRPTFMLEAGQFSDGDLSGYSILARKIDTTTNMLHGLTIYDNRISYKKNIISADSGEFVFSNDMAHFILNLFNGEIHSFKTGEVNAYKIVDFDKFKIISEAQGFGFKRSGREVSRGDREMNIDNMQQIVDKSELAILKSDSTIEHNLSNHIDFILLGLLQEKPKAKSINISNPPKRKLITKSKPISQVKPSKKEAYKRAKSLMRHLTTKLYTDIAIIKQNHSRIRKYTIEIHKKMAIPVACLLFVFIGCPLGIMSKKGNFGFSAGVSLVFYIFYWITLIGGEKLGDRDILNPVMSMWLGNIILLFIGIFLTILVNYESFSFFIPKLFRKRA